ncbi:MAG: hypothetical protein HYW09_00705 [Candidatus Niyogibacteria bacterium]|nr:hypothetical protein [Candidatus Niyogibacteria bacterium]
MSKRNMLYQDNGDLNDGAIYAQEDEVDAEEGGELPEEKEEGEDAEE